MKLRSLRTLTGCLLAFTLGAQLPASAQDTSGPLTDIVNLTGDFYESPWLGTFKLNTEAEGWVWHVDHGWLFAEPFESDGLYLFDPVIPGWLYSERGLYPYMYLAAGSGEWIYFDEMDMGPGNHPRTFYSFESETNFYLPMVGLPNLVQTADAAGIFETLLLAATTAGLADTLAEDGPFTVFAPTDEAFAALGSETIDDLLDDPETLADILLYHVLPGKVFSRDVSSGWFTTANGADIRIDADYGGVMLNGSSSVIEVDIGASNGVVHIIDEVILPPQSIADVAAGADTFNTLLAALTAAELNTIFADNDAGPFTVFAPTDDAFDALPDGTVASLLEPENRDQLVEILTYHVVPGAVYSSQLASGLVDTAAEKSLLVEVGEAGVVINDTATVISADVRASNGVIHVIDAVLLPPAESFVIGFNSDAFQYTINGEIAPELEMTRGQTYLFARSDFGGHPFALSTVAPGSAWEESNLYGDQILTTPTGFFYTPDESTPDMLYYRCTVHASMGAGISVLDANSGDSAVIDDSVPTVPGDGGSYGY